MVLNKRKRNVPGGCHPDSTAVFVVIFVEKYQQAYSIELCWKLGMKVSSWSHVTESSYKSVSQDNFSVVLCLVFNDKNAGLRKCTSLLVQRLRGDQEVEGTSESDMFALDLNSSPSHKHIWSLKTWHLEPLSTMHCNGGDLRSKICIPRWKGQMSDSNAPPPAL